MQRISPITCVSSAQECNESFQREQFHVRRKVPRISFSPKKQFQVSILEVFSSTVSNVCSVSLGLPGASFASKTTLKLKLELQAWVTDQHLTVL